MTGSAELPVEEVRAYLDVLAFEVWSYPDDAEEWTWRSPRSVSSVARLEDVRELLARRHHPYGLCP